MDIPGLTGASPSFGAAFTRCGAGSAFLRFTAAGINAVLSRFRSRNSGSAVMVAFPDITMGRLGKDGCGGGRGMVVLGACVAPRDAGLEIPR